MTSAVLDSLKASRGAHVTEVGRESGKMLRTFLDGRPAADAAQPARREVQRMPQIPAVPADPFMAARSTAERFAVVDTLAANVPAGFYALARTKESASGNDITFFEVIKTKAVDGKPGRTYIKQLTGAPFHWVRESLRLHHQYFAYRHILSDLAAAGALFAEKAVACRRCGSPLNNKKSRERGYGSGCWSIVRGGGH